MNKIGVFIAILIWSCGVEPAKNKWIQNELHGNAQGTTFNIKFLTTDSLDLSQEIATLFEYVDQQLSSYIPTSTLSKFNASPITKRAIAKNDTLFLAVLKESIEMAELSKGYFNPSVMPLVNYWGFAFKSSFPELIDSAYVDSLRQLVLDLTTIQIQHTEDSIFIVLNANTQFDFNGNAQGYTVDLIAELLEANQCVNYLVEVGGEVRAKGKNLNNELWAIGIDKPIEKSNERELQAILRLNNRALATSGNYRKFYVKNGKKYAHSIDPFTGYPVQHSLLSATVVAERCATADALATAFMVMGVEKTKNFLMHHEEIEVYLIYTDENGKYQTWMSKNMPASIEEM